MKNFVCLYAVEIEDSYTNAETKATEYATKTEEGLLYADNFVDAVKQLEEVLYGDCLYRILEIELFDAMAVFSHETIERIRKELNEND